jgi:threonine dehydrogenase-like Zn-dependent dehydrogenase
VLGIMTHDGAFAEYLALPLENLHVVPDSVSDEKAVFVEPLAAACEILEQVDVKKFRSAAVLGDGKLAQLIARVLRTMVRRVVMYGKHEKKLALARLARIDTKKVHGDAGDLKRIKESYALLVEATGSPNGLALAQQMTEPRGTLVLKSTFHARRQSKPGPLWSRCLMWWAHAAGRLRKPLRCCVPARSILHHSSHGHFRSAMLKKQWASRSSLEY